MTHYPRDADLKNGSCQKGERERAHLQNNIKRKPEQLKLGKSYPIHMAINSQLLTYKT
jgi:hypothetical protein